MPGCDLDCLMLQTMTCSARMRITPQGPLVVNESGVLAFDGADNGCNQCQWPP